jgi:hypothetical protein
VVIWELTLLCHWLDLRFKWGKIRRKFLHVFHSTVKNWPVRFWIHEYTHGQLIHRKMLLEAICLVKHALDDLE